MIDDVVVGMKPRLESQLSRMNCQMSSTGFSSGHLAGSGAIAMLSGTMSLRRHVPSGLIEQQHCMAAGRDPGRDGCQMQVHRLGGVAPGQHEARGLTFVGVMAPKM